MTQGFAKRDLSLICVIALILVFLNAPTECRGEPFPIEIDVAPNTLNIQSQGTVVTVHTDIPFAAVDALSVSLNYIEIRSYKADNCGNFVAKFLMSAVKDLVDEGHLELGIIMLTLRGLTNDNTEFTGSQEITVINIEPAGAGGE